MWRSARHSLTVATDRDRAAPRSTVCARRRYLGPVEDATSMGGTRSTRRRWAAQDRRDIGGWHHENDASSRLRAPESVTKRRFRGATPRRRVDLVPPADVASILCRPATLRRPQDPGVAFVHRRWNAERHGRGPWPQSGYDGQTSTWRVPPPCCASSGKHLHHARSRDAWSATSATRASRQLRPASSRSAWTLRRQG